AAGRLVGFARQQRREQHLLGARGGHLFADDALDVGAHPQSERQPGEDPRRVAPDVTGPHEQLVAGRLGVGGVFLQGADEELGQERGHPFTVSAPACGILHDADRPRAHPVTTLLPTEERASSSCTAGAAPTTPMTSAATSCTPVEAGAAQSGPGSPAHDGGSGPASASVGSGAFCALTSSATSPSMPNSTPRVSPSSPTMPEASAAVVEPSVVASGVTIPETTGVRMPATRGPRPARRAGVSPESRAPTAPHSVDPTSGMLHSPAVWEKLAPTTAVPAASAARLASSETVSRPSS